MQIIFLYLLIIGFHAEMVAIDNWPIDPLATRLLTEDNEDRILSTKQIIMSLGDNCQPAYYLSLCKLRHMAFPFDWMATPINDLFDIIENDFAYFKPEFFAQAYDPECHAINPVNIHYPKVRFPHTKWEFLFEDLNRRIRRYYKAIQYCILSKKFFYFIIHSLDFTENNVIERSSGDLCGLLLRKFPNLNFKLIVMHHSSKLSKIQDNNRIFVYLKHGWNEQSHGEWEQKFKELGLINYDSDINLPNYNFSENYFNE